MPVTGGETGKLYRKSFDNDLECASEEDDYIVKLRKKFKTIEKMNCWRLEKNVNVSYWGPCYDHKKLLK